MAAPFTCPVVAAGTQGGPRRRLLVRAKIKSPRALLGPLLLLAVLTFPAESAPANLTVCFHTRLHGDTAAESPAELLAMQAAVSDVRARACSLLGSGGLSSAACASLPNGFMLKAVVVASAGAGAAAARQAAEECIASGSDVIVGPGGAEHAALVTLVAGASGVPLVSYSATSASLSDEAVTPLLARTAFSDGLIATAAASLFRQMAWSHVAILHDCTAAAHALAASLERNAVDADTTLHPFATCGGSRALSHSLHVVGASGVQVVLVLGLLEELSAIMREADALGLISRDLRFLHMDVYPEALMPDTSPSAATSLPTWPSDTLRPIAVPALQERLSKVTADDIGEVLLLGEDGGEELLKPAAPSQPPAQHLPLAAMAAYDAIWGIALAGARVDADVAGAGGVGAAVYQQLASGSVSFDGVSGRVSWDGNGDRSVATAVVDISYLAPVEGGAHVQRLATWTDGSGLSLHAISDPELWPPLGSAAPPPLCSEQRQSSCPQCDPAGAAATLCPVGVVVGIALSVGAALLALALWAILRLYRQRRVTIAPNSPTRPKSRHSLSTRRSAVGITPFQSRAIEVVDLEPPVAKMLRFLRRCEAGVFKRPSGAEAAALRQLIEASDDLMSPNLQQSLGIGQDGYSPYSEGVAEYLMHQTSMAPNKSRKRTTLKTYSSTSSGGCHTKSRLRPSSSQREDGEPLGSRKGDGDRRKSDGDRRKLLLEVPFAEIVDHDAHEFQVASPKDVVGPMASVRSIGLDYGLDFITPTSPMRSAEEALVVVVKQALVALNLDKCLKTKQSILRLLSLARRLEGGYLEDGYHNRFHAADVTNRLACVLRHSGISEAASRSTSQTLHILAAILAACAHDFEHPQVTNGFLVETEEPMAIAFNFQAVAENHSLRTSLALMSQADYNFMEDWEPAQAKELKRTVIRMVLATDMSRHFEMLVQYKTKVVNSEAIAGKTGQEAYAAMDLNQRMMTLQMAMKVADLGHCMLPIEQHKQWVEALQEEMFRQGDREKELRLEVSPMMDRTKTGVNHPDSQVGFFEVIVLPLIQLWVELFPSCSTLLNQTEANLQHWMDAQDQQHAAAAARQMEQSNLPMQKSKSPLGRGKKRIRWTVGPSAIHPPLEARRISSAHKIVI